MPQVELRNTVKTYYSGDQALNAVNNVSFAVKKGDFISIVGHSGSGKTTLLSLIGGIISPTSGAVFFDGADLSSLGSDQLSEYRSGKIGFMFQFASLLPMLTVKENLLLPTAFPAQLAHRADGEKKARDLLRMVGLSSKIDAYPAHLSGGQQRRVAIARAFMNNPSLILADEPTGDLDEDTEMDMMNFFRTMNRAEEITFIIVTHNTDLANLTRRRITMHQGSVREEESR